MEYQREGFDMFAAMMDGIKEEAVGFLFNLEVQVEDDADETEDDEVEAEEPMRRDLAAEAAAREAAPLIRAKGLEAPSRPQNLSYTAPSEQGAAEIQSGTVTTADDPYANVGRNQLCPCGSGKKYKRCHGAPGGPTGLTARASG